MSKKPICIVNLRLDKFSVDGDGDIVAHQKIAGLKRSIRRKAIVFAIDFVIAEPPIQVSMGLYRKLLGPPRKPNLTSNAVNRQVAFNCMFVIGLSITQIDLNESVGNFSTSKKSALYKWVSRSGSRVSSKAESMVTSILELLTSCSSTLSAPDTPDN